MAFILLLAMLAVCSASPQDMTDKMFTFPEETDTTHVKLTPSTQSMDAASVCLRFFTDLRRPYVLFSMSSPRGDNTFLMFMYPGDKSGVAVGNVDAFFYGHNLPLNTWNSACATWDRTSGLAQLWINGNPSSRKLTTSGSGIRGPFTIILGQEQDVQNGKFDIKQSFVGMISDVHMWDRVITLSEIQSFKNRLSFTPGNVLNWRALDFQVVGRLLIEDK